MVRSVHLKRIHKVFNQEEAAHLLQGPIDVGQTAVHMLLEILWWDADILFYQCSAEGRKRKVSSKRSRLKVFEKNTKQQQYNN